MSLVKSYAFSDHLFASVDYAYGLDPRTRLCIRLSRYVDLIQRVDPPQLAWDAQDHEFMWCFAVERRATVSWDEITIVIQKAANDFFATCKSTDWP